MDESSDKSLAKPQPTANRGKSGGKAVGARRKAGKPRNYQKKTPKLLKNKYAQKKLEYDDITKRQAAVKARVATSYTAEEAGYMVAEGAEDTLEVTQDKLKELVDINTASKIFELDLPMTGPFALDYSPDTNMLLIGGQKGHVASFDWRKGNLRSEFQVDETVHDVHWLHNSTLFATAQKKYAYIYNYHGQEVHCLRGHVKPRQLEFLPFHLLLVSSCDFSRLVYQDVSIGEIVASFKTNLGVSRAMVQNPWNATINLAHNNGTVTMWSPTVAKPLVKMLCHRSPVDAVAVDPTGHYMATAGQDNKVNLWDIRTYKKLNTYDTKQAATALSISQRGALAVSSPYLTCVWKNSFKEAQAKPYMQCSMSTDYIKTLKFCPYEDVLGVGHSKGFSSLVIPGAGDPNFDSYMPNPFNTRKQRQEREVQQLLEKLRPDMITLDPTFIGTLNEKSDERKELDRKKKDLADRQARRQKRSQRSTRGAPKSKPMRIEAADASSGDEVSDHETTIVAGDHQSKSDEDENVTADTFTAKKKRKGRNSTLRKLETQRQRQSMDSRSNRQVERLDRDQQRQDRKMRNTPYNTDAAQSDQPRAALSRFYKGKRTNRPS
ncbi:putative U3 small nucleolar RNA-associated protein 7 [Dispira parvispora]|uniref:U three protein 7 n=1 Tax=Dispira parvispora TaxID=1520584 RepID=A0A9W8AIJ9_9FUNG|nr:putative U3 small nucleolar RNA-associated protein 7 [Dispira parvispora]